MLDVDAFAHAFDDEAMLTLLDNPAFARLERFRFKQPAHYPALSEAVLRRLEARFGKAR